MTPLLLTINTGSSSLKATAYALDAALPRVLWASADRIGGENSRLVIGSRDAPAPVARQASLADHTAALRALVDWLGEEGYAGRIRAAGHRIVHGGPKLAQPQLVTPDVVAELRRITPFAPEHLPQAIAAIEELARALPETPQCVCFDTAFHRTLPRRAKLLPIPYEYFEAGVARYGFHGLSYEYLVDRLRQLDPERAGGRAVLAHLGNGASMAAVDCGVCVDTSMAFTPAAGLVMGSRSGDLDPGVLVYLMDQHKIAARDLNHFINKRCGLAGLSGGHSDMRELLARRASDERAAAAVELYVYQARKFAGAYAAALGGLDTLVFAGGVGEHAVEIRAEICAGLEFLGLRLDPTKNSRGAEVISAPDSRLIARVIATDEDLMIARHVHRLLQEQSRVDARERSGSAGVEKSGPLGKEDSGSCS